MLHQTSTFPFQRGGEKILLWYLRDVRHNDRKIKSISNESLSASIVSSIQYQSTSFSSLFFVTNFCVTLKKEYQTILHLKGF